MSSQNTNILDGQWIVRLRPFASAQVQADHVSSLQSLTADNNTAFNCQVQQQFELPEFRGYSATFTQETKTEIEQMSEVLAVEPVQIYTHCKTVTQKDATWGLQRVSASGKVGSPPFTYKYDDKAAGEGVIAYVLDTGINNTHVEFGGRARKAPKKFVNTWLGRGQTVSDEDTNGHGTHCAGTIGSAAYGVAKKVEIIGVKVFNDVKPRPDATNADIIEAIQYVVDEHERHGKKSVINLSLGGGPSDALDIAVAAAVRSGVVVCVAAGNDNKPAEVGSPAREPLAITVGATAIDEKLYEFSNYGKVVDILAPGVDILSCWKGSMTATETITGTSMASPHVAGVICSLLSNPALKDVATTEIMSQVLIQADKNTLTSLNKTDDRLAKKTINAVVQVHNL